jgi:hypothetical protein
MWIRCSPIIAIITLFGCSFSADYGDAKNATEVFHQATTSGTFVTMTSSRVCANGILSERFTWLMIGGKATLLGYNANSPLLLTD